MDLFNSYSKVLAVMGQNRLHLNTGTRNHASIAQLESRSITLEKGGAISLQQYSEAKRYVLAKSITFDMLISIYDVNSRGALLMRPSRPIDRKEAERLERNLRRFRNANLELRAIGLQNGWRGYAKTVNDIYGMSKGHYIEIDLFGSDKRHIAIDLKTGTSYDLFLENRIYRPGELANDEKEADFQSSVSALSFI